MPGSATHQLSVWTLTRNCEASSVVIICLRGRSSSNSLQSVSARTRHRVPKIDKKMSAPRVDLTVVLGILRHPLGDPPKHLPRTSLLDELSE